MDLESARSFYRSAPFKRGFTFAHSIAEAEEMMAELRQFYPDDLFCGTVRTVSPSIKTTTPFMLDLRAHEDGGAHAFDRQHGRLVGQSLVGWRMVPEMLALFDAQAQALK